MATLEGKKYEVSLGNLRKASPQEQKIIQDIIDLKAKQKMINDEISKRCGMLEKEIAISCHVRTEDETKWITCIASRPKWMHMPIPEWGIIKYNTTKGDKKDLDIND